MADERSGVNPEPENVPTQERSLESGSSLHIPAIVTELSTLRTRQESLRAWVDQQKGTDSYKRFVIPLVLSIVIGVISYLYIDTKTELKELTREFNEYRIAATERLVKVENHSHN